MVLDLNRVMMQAHVQCVEVMVKLDLAKGSLLYNKHALSVLDQVKWLLIPAGVAEDNEKNKHQKDFQSQFQKVLMMAQELD